MFVKDTYVHEFANKHGKEPSVVKPCFLPHVWRPTLIHQRILISARPIIGDPASEARLIGNSLRHLLRTSLNLPNRELQALVHPTTRSLIHSCHDKVILVNY